MPLLIQLIGSALVLAAFGANQIWRTSDSSRLYLTANALGSFGLAVSALTGSQWGFLALEGTWCLVSLTGLLRSYAPTPARAPRAGRFPQGQRPQQHRRDSQERMTWIP